MGCYYINDIFAAKEWADEKRIDESFKNEMMMVMHDQEQEIEKLKSQVAELQAKLDGYEIKVSESGNLAEAVREGQRPF